MIPRTALLGAVLGAWLASPALGAEVYIGVGGSASGGASWAIGLPAFASERGRPEDDKLGHKMKAVLRDDLLASRYFKVVEPPAAVSELSGAEAADEWRKAGAAFVLAARVADLGAKITLNVAVTDLASGQTVLDRYYRQDGRFWRSVSHKVADDIVRQLTGRPGIAHTQLAFVNDQTGNKEVYLIDYDGEGLRRLTHDRSIDLLPRWHPGGKKLLYTTYKHGNPDLIELDLERGASRVLASHQGLNLAGGFTADGSQLVMTQSRQKDPNLYQLSLGDMSFRKITDHFGVDSSPSFSPDGNQIAFASDRNGNPQIHVLDVTTGRIRRLTRLNWCDSPAWSPTGEWIVFSGRANPKDPMDVFLVDITGSHLRQLTHGEGSNEDPVWSPDGRFIAFTSTRLGRKRKLFYMDADGSAPHPVADIPGQSFTPSWSP